MTIAMTNERNYKGVKVFSLMLLLMMVTSFFTPFGSLVASAEESASNNGIPGVTLNENGVELSGSGFSSGGDEGSAWNQIISKYRTFIVGISGIAAITMVVIFIFQFLKLGASAGNPQARSQALTGLLWSGLAAAGLGSVSLIVGLFYRSIQ